MVDVALVTGCRTSRRPGPVSHHGGLPSAVGKHAPVPQSLPVRGPTLEHVAPAGKEKASLIILFFTSSLVCVLIRRGLLLRFLGVYDPNHHSLGFLLMCFASMSFSSATK